LLKYKFQFAGGNHKFFSEQYPAVQTIQFHKPDTLPKDTDSEAIAYGFGVVKFVKTKHIQLKVRIPCAWTSGAGIRRINAVAIVSGFNPAASESSNL